MWFSLSESEMEIKSPSPETELFGRPPKPQTVRQMNGAGTEIKGLADAYLEDDLIGKVVAVQADTKASRAGIDGLSTDLKELFKAVVEGHQQLTVTLKSVAAEIVGKKEIAAMNK